MEPQVRNSLLILGTGLSFDADGTLEFLAVKEEGLYRVEYIPVR